jgi:hypothetical protein
MSLGQFHKFRLTGLPVVQAASRKIRGTKWYFYGTSRQIKFGLRHLFPDFLKQNQEKDASIQRI